MLSYVRPMLCCYGAMMNKDVYIITASHRHIVDDVGDHLMSEKCTYLFILKESMYTANANVVGLS